MRYGIDFKGDMRYVAELARRAGKRVETVDEDLLSVYEKDREVFRPRLVLILLVLLLYFSLVVYGLRATAVGFLTGHYAQATIWLIITLLTIVVTPPIFARSFINATMTIRDTKLITECRSSSTRGTRS